MSLKALQIDNGKEHTVNEFEKYHRKHGIHH